MKSLEQQLQEKDRELRELRKTTKQGGASRRTVLNESGPTDAKMVETYRLLGLSEKEAAIAANIQHTVGTIQESRQRLADAAKLLGMSEAEADLFSRI